MRRRGIFLCLVLGAAAGCGSGQPSGLKPLRVWHWMTDREQAFDELAKRYQQQTGQAVQFELYAPSDVYVQKVRAAAQTNGLPEIYGVLGEMRDVASFIQAGHVLPLQPAMDADGGAWRNQFYPKALAVNAFPKGNTYGIDPGVYGVPIDVMNIQLFYNKKLLAQLGADPNAPPATWEAFLQLGKKAKQQQLIGFVSGWAELWLLDCFATDYAIHEMGMRKVEDTYAGKVAYTDPGWIRVLGRFAQLRDSGMLAEGIVTMVNKQAEQLFANERAVFAFNGTWGVNVYKSMNPSLEYGVMLPPRVNDRAMVTWGGAGSSFSVNAKAARSQDAVAFLKWLTAAPQQQYLLEATQNIPANREAAAGLTGPLASFAQAMDVTVHPRLFPVQEDTTVLEAFGKGIQSILIGEATPEQVAANVEQVKQRQVQRQVQLNDAAHAVR